MHEPADVAVRHAEWELPEVGVAVILLTFVVVVATSAAAGVVAGVVGEPGVSPPWHETVGVALQDATQWSFPFFIFPVVFAVGLVWWQVHTWVAVIEDAAAGIEPGPSRAGVLRRLRRRGEAPSDDAEAELLAAFDHLLRARTLATWAVPILGAALVAAIGSVLGDFLSNSGGAVGGFVWGDRVRTIGWAAATGVFAGSAVVIAAYLRQHVDREFAFAEHAAAEEARRAEPPPASAGVDVEP